MQALIKDNLAQIQHLMRLHSVERAYLFGSAARNAMGVDSDVDFVVRFTDQLDFEDYSDNYFGLLYALQQLLNRDVELVAEETLSNPYLLESINQSKVPVL